MIEQAAADGARLVVLTEMYATGFSMKTDRIAEPVDGPSAQFLVEQAARARRVGLRVGTRARSAAPTRAYRNNSVLAAPDGSTQRYAKIHPFTYGRGARALLRRRRLPHRRDRRRRCSFFVCYDLRFADEFWALAEQTDLLRRARELARVAARTLVALLQARAIENQAYVVGVNRVGAVEAS